MQIACTAAVTRALEAAQRLAEQQQSLQVWPAHVLAGLVREEEGAAASLLRRLGVDLAAIRRALEYAAYEPCRPPGTGRACLPPSVPPSQGGMCPSVPPSQGGMCLPPSVPPSQGGMKGLGGLALPAPLLPWGQGISQALNRARQLAAAVSADPAITSEQLLLALIEADDALLRLLEPLGLEPGRLQAELQAWQPAPVPLDEPLQLPEPTDTIDAARMLDAGANRGREALRVVEDYCRFVLDDPFLSGELKQLRHQLACSLNKLAPQLLLEARETLRDVGTALATAQERERHSLREVALANFKRLQESLRSLEEVGKLFSPELAEGIEQLRYRSYTLERACLQGASARERLADAGLYVLLTKARCAAALDWTIREAAAGGAAIFQLREKDLDDGALLERARAVRRSTRDAGVLFIVNDRPDIARLAEADGVHLGQEDLAVKDARRIVGPDALIGVSTHNLQQLRQAILDGASYIGVGPAFASGTKQFAELAGLDFVRQATAETSLPAFVIGGVTRQNIASALAAGARRVAVSQAICQADAPRQAAAELRQALTNAQ